LKGLSEVQICGETSKLAVVFRLQIVSCDPALGIYLMFLMVTRSWPRHIAARQSTQPTLGSLDSPGSRRSGVWIENTIRVFRYTHILREAQTARQQPETMGKDAIESQPGDGTKPIFAPAGRVDQGRRGFGIGHREQGDSSRLRRNRWRAYTLC